jgi:2'-hydroxyisoflavone reductase
VVGEAQPHRVDAGDVPPRLDLRVAVDGVEELLEAAVEATGSGARLTWVSDDALVEAGVEPWMELPLWIPERDGAGTWQVAAARAEAAGLRPRPVAETVADVWAWLRAGGPDAEGPDWLSPHAPQGMAPEREQELLAAVRG